MTALPASNSSRDASGPSPVGSLRPGQSGRVVQVASIDAARVVRLSNLGVLPGATVTLIQRRPAVVIRVGETQIALDPEVAADILVEP